MRIASNPAPASPNGRAELNPYDEVPYQSHPIEWTAPERLALASALHGGPRPPLKQYRYLELGCGDGANLLPLAFYRRDSTFVGLDAAGTQIHIARSRQSELVVSNISFVHASFLNAAAQLSGEFDYIVAHGVFSWVSDAERDALLELCATRLRRGGLVYLNYNSRPGWNVRGMVRDFLRAQTERETNLAARARLAQEVSARLASLLSASEHAYSQLMANEFRFVSDNHPSWVAHEFLAIDNHAYWRGEFLALVERHGLEYVADADFNYVSGRTQEPLRKQLEDESLVGSSIDDTLDLLCYRQMHCPILTLLPWKVRAYTVDEFAGLYVASSLVPGSGDYAGSVVFEHSSGYQVETKDEPIGSALRKLQLLWPRGLPVQSLFPDVSAVMEDLTLLHRNGLIELRCSEPDTSTPWGRTANGLANPDGGYVTTPYHTRVALESRA